MREEFERHFPLPPTIYWCAYDNVYKSHFDVYGHYDQRKAYEYNTMLKVWRVAQEALRNSESSLPS